MGFDLLGGLVPCLSRETMYKVRRQLIRDSRVQRRRLDMEATGASWEQIYATYPELKRQTAPPRGFFTRMRGKKWKEELREQGAIFGGPRDWYYPRSGGGRVCGVGR